MRQDSRYGPVSTADRQKVDRLSRELCQDFRNVAWLLNDPITSFGAVTDSLDDFVQVFLVAATARVDQYPENSIAMQQRVATGTS